MDSLGTDPPWQINTLTERHGQYAYLEISEEREMDKLGEIAKELGVDTLHSLVVT